MPDWTDTLRLRESGAVDEFVNPNEPDDVDELEVGNDTALRAGPTHARVAAVDAPRTTGTKKAPAKKTAAKKATGFTRKRA